MVNARVRDKIIAAAELTGTETVLEIGPGLGVLTFELAKRAKHVVAVEVDPVLARRLAAQAKDLRLPNVLVEQGDALNYPITQLPNYLVVSNLPYQITSPFFKKFLEHDPKPSRIVVMIQKEVADRILAKPPKMNPLAILVQLSGTLDLVAKVSPGSFSPPPKVDSAVIRLRDISWPKDLPQKEFMSFVHRGFASPRKKLAHNLGKKQGTAAMVKVHLDPDARPGDLSPVDWVRLWKVWPRQGA